eukprot:Skav211179  [mRNA]  locus=scaffold884:124274:125309:+ [translate_table: standard]
MRTPGGVKLTHREWQALEATSVDGRVDAHKLAGTEHFYQACYTWSVVSLAYTVRSFESAKAAGATLYATRAIDSVQNVPIAKASRVAEALLTHTNMNETGRLPHFGLYHVGMEVRLTQTLAAPHIVVDCIGIIRGFQFAPEDLNRGDMHGPFVVLRKLPEAIFVEFQETPYDFVPAEPCRLHAPELTCEKDMRWLACYVALSRVRSLKQLRSVGLDRRVREILEQGPPDTLPARFRQLFAEKETSTELFAEECLKKLGW